MPQTFVKKMGASWCHFWLKLFSTILFHKSFCRPCKVKKILSVFPWMVWGINNVFSMALLWRTFCIAPFSSTTTSIDYMDFVGVVSWTVIRLSQGYVLVKWGHFSTFYQHALQTVLLCMLRQNNGTGVYIYIYMLVQAVFSLYSSYIYFILGLGLGPVWHTTL